MVHFGKDVDNASEPWGKSPHWFLIGSSSAAPTDKDLESVAVLAGRTVDELRKARLEKNANIGAVLLGSVSADDETRKKSPWVNEKAGFNPWAVLGVIRWTFDANGPSALFKNLNCEVDPDSEPDSKETESVPCASACRCAK